MASAREQVRAALEQMSEDEAAELLALVRTIENRRDKASIFEKLRGDPSFRLPDPDAPPFVSAALGQDVQTIAVTIARRRALRGANAVQLASALHLRRRLSPEEVVLVTSDGEMKTAALAEGFTVLDPAIEDQRASDNSRNC